MVEGFPPVLGQRETLLSAQLPVFCHAIEFIDIKEELSANAVE
jgi:hypothetical protein